MSNGPIETSPQGTITDDTPCPICSYNLRGLYDPKCPECGARFTWNEILDPTRRIHPYLYEHHPERNVRSFLRTILGAAFPIRFWTSLHPNQPLRTARLWMFTLLICIPTVLAPTIALIAGPLVTNVIENNKERKSALATIVPGTPRHTLVIRLWGSVNAFLDDQYPAGVISNFEKILHDRRLKTAWIVLTTVMLMPLMTFVLFANFRYTLSRARLNLQHIVRTIAYNSDIMLWYSLLFISCLTLNDMYSVISKSAFNETITNTAFALAIVFACKIGIAANRYLRFKRALMVAISTQIIVFLIIANVYLISYNGWN